MIQSRVLKAKIVPVPLYPPQSANNVTPIFCPIKLAVWLGYSCAEAIINPHFQTENMADDMLRNCYCNECLMYTFLKLCFSTDFIFLV